MVGRETEQKQATALWSEVLSGQGRVLMISGEPGIGKSRLVRELTTHAEVTGGWALEGASYAESGSPYGPFRQVLREVLSKDSETCCDLPQGVLADVLSLAPELKTHFPDVSANPPLDPQAERQRLFENIVIFFSTLSDHAPLLLILEDAHWADSGTLARMLHLARNTRHKRVMIVAPYREVELDEARPFHEVLLDIQREGLAVRLKLNRLTRSQTQDLLGVLFAEEILPDFLEGIYRETEGNPFFIEEVCKTMLASGKMTFGDGRWHRPSMKELGVPQSVQVAIQSRVGKLPELSQEILKLAAVVGRVFDLETIAKTSDLEEDQLIDAMEDAQNAQLIEGENGREGGVYRFSHALIPSTLVVGLRTRKRRRLHREVATAIEQVCPDDFEALAFHYNQAGEDEKAVTYYLKAGDRARSLFAFQETVYHYEHALEILRDGADIDRAARTLMKLGLAYHNEFDYESAQDAYEEGFTLWQRVAEIPSVLPPAPHALRMDSFEPETLDPSLADGWSIFYSYHLFSGLLQLSPTLNLMPDVASNWEVVDGGRKYIFHLRKDVRWSDGVEVTAGDFEYAMRRVLNPSTKAPYAHLLFDIKGAKDHYQGERDDPEKIGVHAKDEHTLVIELEAPVSYFLYLMANLISFAVPQHVVERNGSAWTEKDSLVTNGPFQLTEWNKGESIILSRNTSYHGYFPGNVDRVERYYIYSGNPEKALQAYLEEDRDILINLNLWGLPKSERERVCHQLADEYVTAPSLNTYCLNFNVRKPPFDDCRVRQAFTLALDRESWTRAVYGNHVFPAMGGFIPPGMPGHSPGIATRYDPEAARALLKEAGYPDGEGLPPLEFYTFSEPAAKYEFENIRLQWLKNLGVEITQVSLESSKHSERISHDEPPIWVGFWGADYLDPDSFIRQYFKYAHKDWKNDSFNEIVSRARSLTDQNERIRLYQQADRILIEEAPLLPLYHSQYNFLVKPWVKKITLSPMTRAAHKYVVLEPH
jgi:oligopeptide transport system substrate-binding protein